MMMQAYSMAIEEVPTWAVEEAARLWISGKCGPQRFAPSPPELRCTSDRVVRVTEGKIACLRKLAKIEVISEPSPENRARAEAFVASLALTAMSPSDQKAA